MSNGINPPIKGESNTVYILAKVHDILSERYSPFQAYTPCGLPWSPLDDLPLSSNIEIYCEDGYNAGVPLTNFLIRKSNGLDLNINCETVLDTFRILTDTESDYILTQNNEYINYN